MGVCSVTVCGWACPPANTTVYATATYDGVSKTVTINVHSYAKWSKSDWNKVPNNEPYIYNSTSLDHNVCYGYSDPYEENGVTKYKYKYNRCCGTTLSAACYKDANDKYHWTTYPDSSWTKTDLDNAHCKDEEIKIPACYKDDDNNYYWTSDPAINWKEVSGITKLDNCKATEDDACYIDTHGEYTWGKHAKDSGYTLVTSISDSASCKKPSESEACYKNDQNDYKWATTAPSGYTKVDTIKTPAECAPVESPACYLYGNDFVWGKYEKVSGYIMIENITDEASCKVITPSPDSDACYVDKDGNYVWGKYSNDSKYTLVSSITNMAQCTGGGGGVPVPATGISTSKLVYIFMAILMAFGVGFIYYSSVVKKNN